jgi:hypothetical protein
MRVADLLVRLEKFDDGRRANLLLNMLATAGVMVLVQPIN